MNDRAKIKGESDTRHISISLFLILPQIYLIKRKWYLSSPASRHWQRESGRRNDTARKTIWLTFAIFAELFGLTASGVATETVEARVSTLWMEEGLVFYIKDPTECLCSVYCLGLTHPF